MISLYQNKDSSVFKSLVQFDNDRTINIFQDNEIMQLKLFDNDMKEICIFNFTKEQKKELLKFIVDCI